MQEEKHMQLTTHMHEGTLLLRIKGELDHHAAQTLMRDIGRNIDETLPKKGLADYNSKPEYRGLFARRYQGIYKAVVFYPDTSVFIQRRKH